MLLRSYTREQNNSWSDDDILRRVTVKKKAARIDLLVSVGNALFRLPCYSCYLAQHSTIMLPHKAIVAVAVIQLLLQQQLYCIAVVFLFCVCIFGLLGFRHTLCCLGASTGLVKNQPGCFFCVIVQCSLSAW